jgi:hypothetical protein
MGDQPKASGTPEQSETPTESNSHKTTLEAPIEAA